jgi:hypothetical protein
MLRSTIDFGLILWSTFGRSKEMRDFPQVLFKFMFELLFEYGLYETICMFKLCNIV